MGVAKGPPGSSPNAEGAPPTIPEPLSSAQAVSVSELEWDDDEQPTEQDVTLVLSLGAEAAQKALRSVNIGIDAARQTSSKPGGVKAVTFDDEPTSTDSGVVSGAGQASRPNGTVQPLVALPLEIEDMATAVHSPAAVEALLAGAHPAREDLGATVVRDSLALVLRETEDLGATTLRVPSESGALRPAPPPLPGVGSELGGPTPRQPPPAERLGETQGVASDPRLGASSDDATMMYPVVAARQAAPLVPPPLGTMARASVPGTRPGLPPAVAPPAPPFVPPPFASPPGSASSPLPPPHAGNVSATRPRAATLQGGIAAQTGLGALLARPLGNRSRWARPGTLQGVAPPPPASPRPSGELPSLTTAPGGSLLARSTTLQGLPRAATPTPLPPAVAPPVRPTAVSSPRLDMPDLVPEGDEEDEATLIFGKPHDGSPSSPPGRQPSGGLARRAVAPGPAAGAPATPLPGAPAAQAPFPQPSPLGPQRTSTPAPPTAQPTPALSDMQRAMQASLPVITSKTNRMGAVLAGIAFVVSATLAVFLLLPRTGSLVVEIDPDNGGPVTSAEVFIDGRKVCDQAPCSVSELSPGPKSIRVNAPGFIPPDLVIENVEAGREAHVKVRLRGATPVRGGVRLSSKQPGVKVFVDGNERGTLPTSFDDLPPGTHALRFDGGERFSSLERTVDIVSGKILDLDDLRLSVRKGRATITLATKGADVRLVRAPDSKRDKSVRKLDGPWPMTIDVEVSDGLRLVASKKGLDSFSRDLDFSDGNPEASIRIELEKPGAEPPPEPIVAEPKTVEPPEPKTPAPPPAIPPPEPKTAAPPPKKPEVAAVGGSGTLNVNSLPLSSVLIDGRPYGSTPKTDISLPAGSHTVTFVHPELGRKSVTVNVEAGKSATAVVRFKKPEP